MPRPRPRGRLPCGRRSEQAAGLSGPQSSSPSSGPKRMPRDAVRVPEQTGPSCGSEGHSEAGTVPEALLPERGLGLSAAAAPVAWAVSGTTGHRHSGLPCRDKALSSVSSPGGSQCLCLGVTTVSVCTLGSPQLPRSVPVSPGGTSSCGHLLQRNWGLLPEAVLGEAARPQPAGSLPKCITGGETSEGERPQDVRRGER